MKQIYRFDHTTPPYLNERLLREELERRRMRRQVTLLAVGSLLSVFCLIFAAVLFYNILPMLALICAAYLCMAAISCGMMALVLVKQREELLSQWSYG